MKKFPIIILFLIFISSINISAQTRWIEDSEMNFKIAIPENYQTNLFKEGNDKIHAFVSPDQNLAIRIRSFRVSANTTLEQTINLFRQNIISGSTQLVIQPFVLNGIDGQMSGYRWRYNNIDVIVGAFYTIQNGIAYIVWSIIPENLFLQRNVESDAITNSFTLTNLNSPISNNTAGLGNIGALGNMSGNGNLSESSNQIDSKITGNKPSPLNIQITDATIGSQIDSNFRITNQNEKITTSTERINIGFGYIGNASGHTFFTRWHNTDQNKLLSEFPFFPPDEPSGRGYAYIDNIGETLLSGNYKVEILINDQILKVVTFSIYEKEKTNQALITPVEGYNILVSDDACIEHFIDKKAILRKAEQGQKIWDIPITSTTKNVIMVMQNITKQGRDFKSFITEQINAIKSKGASVRSQDFDTANGLLVCNYWYELQGTMFLYTAVDGPNSFYLLGFVGSIDYEGDVIKQHKIVKESFMKAECPSVY